MTTFFMLLATGAIAFAAGWAIACVALAQSHMRQAHDFDRERQELEDDRRALLEFTRAQVDQERTRISWDLGAQKRLSREVQ
jgi:signal transduction histidine kinase